MNPSYYALKIFALAIVIEGVTGKLCLSCFKSEKNPIEDRDYITKSNLGYYFKRSPIFADIPICTSRIHFVECSGMCLSIEAKYKSLTLGQIYTCSDKYKPYNFDELNSGECLKSEHEIFMRTQSLETCVCDENLCNKPKNDKSENIDDKKKEEEQPTSMPTPKPKRKDEKNGFVSNSPSTFVHIFMGIAILSLRIYF